MKALFIESSIFSRYREDLMDDESYRDFQSFLMDNPTAGDVIPSTGGLRKIRWSANGKGKRGGSRIIYIYLDNNHHFHLLTIYGKNEAEDLRQEEKRILTQLAEKLKNEA
jgi:mRNA-degrading endonuclease RelE of RelBE toxin-antitoxin system